MIRVGPQRIIAIRYVMKNSNEDVLANTMAQEPVTFMYGSGEILPGLETPLKGLKIGEQKSFTLSPLTTPELDQTYHFHVIIDDVRWPAEILPAMGSAPESGAGECGPDCVC